MIRPIRVIVGTARAGIVHKITRLVCPNGAPGHLVDLVRDWRGVPHYCVTDGTDVWFLDAAALVRCQS